MGNKKLLIWVGLLLASSIIIPHYVKASLDFWTISIANPDNPSEWITIMDRNLGATSNDINSTESYWYYYQRWNNYGFSNNQTNMKDELVDLSQYSPNKPYKNGNFVRWYFDDYYQHYSYRASPDNENIRWWWEDSFENQRWYDLNNFEERQWPCPNGYHVPNWYERWLLIKYWSENNDTEYVWSESSSNFTSYLSDNYSDFYNYFHLPIAGAIHAGNGEIVDRIHWTYWSSTPVKNSDHIGSSISLTLHQLYVWVGNSSRARWSSIRCFKNTYEPTVTTNKEDSTDCDDPTIKLACWDPNSELYIHCPKMCKKNATLTNNLTKAVEFNLNESNRKTVFNGTYTSLYDDTKINYYSFETTYNPTIDNDYIEKRCEKNKTEMILYLYIDWDLVKSTHMLDTCTLWQGAGFGGRFDEINIKKWQAKNVRVELEIKWSIQEDDTYNFKLSLDKVDSDFNKLFGWEVNADVAPIKLVHKTKIIDTSENDTEKKNNDTKTITSSFVSYWNPSEILNNWYTREMNDAYKFSYKNWITTSNNINKAKMNSPLTRIAMAKMLSNYAINILWKTPDTSKWTPVFNDVTYKQNFDYWNAVTLSYQLWIMWQNMKNNNFRPNDEVTRAEFATALSRMLYWIEDGEWNKYYEPHIAKLYSEWIINNTNPKTREKRWYVMLMLMRSVE